MTTNIFDVLYEDSDESLPNDLIIEEFLDYSDGKFNVIKTESNVIITINNFKDKILELDFILENYKLNKYIIKNINIHIPRKNIQHNYSKEKMLFPSKFTKKEFSDIIYNIKKNKDCRFYIYNDGNFLSISLGYSEEKKKFFISCSFEYGEKDGPIHMYIFLINNSYNITDELRNLII